MPLDPRQEEWYRLGMDWFMRESDISMYFHALGDNFDLILEYRESDESKTFAEKRSWRSAVKDRRSEI